MRALSITLLTLLGLPSLFAQQQDIITLGDGFTAEDCSCNGEVLVSGDCTRAFYCNAQLPSGGRELSCPDGEIILLDADNFAFSCTSDSALCMANGTDYSVGCEGPGPTPPVTLPVTTEEPQDNPFTYEDCTCEGELLLTGDCTQGFYCHYQLATGGKDLSCEPGQIIALDQNTMSLECSSDTSLCVANGTDFSVGCNNPTQPPITTTEGPSTPDSPETTQSPNNDDGPSAQDCARDGDLLFSLNYSKAFYCQMDVEDGGTDFECPDGIIRAINTEDLTWTCLATD